MRFYFSAHGSVLTAARLSLRRFSPAPHAKADIHTTHDRVSILTNGFPNYSR